MTQEVNCIRCRRPILVNVPDDRPELVRLSRILVCDSCSDKITRHPKQSHVTDLKVRESRPRYRDD